MKTAILILLLVLILMAAALYVYRAKKSGKKCIGCPEGCNTKKGSCSGCGCNGK